MEKSINFLNITKLSPPARLGIQAFIAILLASGVGYLFHLEKSYWATLTAMLLISQTWGESIKRSFERVTMTIVGGIVGTILYFYLKDYPLVMFTLILLCTFFMVYFFETSYLKTVFFVTIFVVFLFASLRGWNTQLLEARIYETLIGAVIAVFTSFLVLPISAKTNFSNQIQRLFDELSSALNNGFDYLRGDKHENCKDLRSTSKKLLAGLSELQTGTEAMAYENLFKLYPRQTLKDILVQLRLLFHYTTSFIDTVPTSEQHSELSALHPEFVSLQKIMNNNFKLITELFAGKSKASTLEDFETVRQDIHQKTLRLMRENPNKKDCWIDFFPLMYFLAKINDALIELDRVLSQK